MCFHFLMRSGESKCELVMLWKKVSNLKDLVFYTEQFKALETWNVSDEQKINTAAPLPTRCCSGSSPSWHELKSVFCSVWGSVRPSALIAAPRAQIFPQFSFFLFSSGLFNNADTVNLTPNFQSYWWLTYPFKTLSDLFISPVMAAVDCQLLYMTGSQMMPLIWMCILLFCTCTSHQNLCVLLKLSMSVYKKKREYSEKSAALMVTSRLQLY